MWVTCNRVRVLESWPISIVVCTVCWIDVLYVKALHVELSSSVPPPHADRLKTLSAFFSIVFFFFCTLLMNHYESLIWSQLILLVSSVKSWNTFFFVDLHNVSNPKVKDKRLENASGDLLSTIKWLNLFLVIFYEAQLLTCWFQCGWHSTRLN